MVKIPTSPGVQARPQQVTPTVRQPVDTGERFIAQGITQLGSAIAGIGQQAMIQEQRDQEAFNASQVLQYKNELRRFDNQEKIALSEAGANQDVITKSKQDILDRRKLFTDELKQQFGDNKQVQALIERESQSSLVDLEFNVDKDLSRKRKTYGENQFYGSVSDLRNDFENTQSPEELASIANELQTLQATALNAGIVDMKDIERLEKDFKTIRKEREQEALQEATFINATQGNLFLDSTDKNDRKVINKGFEKYRELTDDPEGLARDISVNTGIVPDVYKKGLNSMLFVGNPDRKIESANEIINLIRENPTLDRQFDDKTKALAQAIESRINVGLSSEEVVKFAEDEINKNKDKNKIIRQQEFELDYSKKGKKFIETINDITDEIKDKSGIFFEAETPKEMSFDVLTIAKDYYINNGSDIDDAIELATEKVKSRWAITNIGGERYQKFAPEAEYPNMTSKELRQQARNLAGKYLSDKSVIKDNIRAVIIPDSLNTNKPNYNLLIEDEFGKIDNIRDESNNPVVWTPDITKTERYKEVPKETRESLNELSKKEFIKQDRANKKQREENRKRLQKLHIQYR
jgi:hypothetical protein